MRGLIIGTGYSLRSQLDLIPRFDGLIFGPNNTFQDFPLDVWTAVDESWHGLYSPVSGSFDKWHWHSGVCKRYGYRQFEGVWADGLVLDEPKISYNHCSTAQLLNLAASPYFYGCDEVILVGHDFHFNAPARHYFDDLSDVSGEYPQEIRKFSQFIKPPGQDDLLAVYRRISETPNCPRIINCTPGSALPWFPMGELEDYISENNTPVRQRVGVA